MAVTEGLPRIVPQQQMPLPAETGEISRFDSAFVELASGLNYLDQAGEWRQTQERFEITPDGFAVARFGPHQLILEPNVNSLTAVDFMTSDGVRLRHAGVFEFELHGEPGQTYRLETSSNLVNWNFLTSFVYGTAPVVFQDFDSTSAPIRFYRGVSP